MSITFEGTTINCGQEGCNITFAISTNLYDHLQRTGKEWYCPSGHCRVYKKPKDDEVEQLRSLIANKDRNLQALARTIDAKESALKTLARRVRAYKGIARRRAS